MTGIAEDTVRVYSRPLAVRVVGTIRANTVLETMCAIYVDNLNILRDSAPLYLRVTVLLKGQPHNIHLMLDQFRVKGVYRQGVLKLGVRPLFQVREVNLVDLILKLEFFP